MNTFLNVMTVIVMICIVVLAGGLLWYIADYMRKNPDNPTLPDTPFLPDKPIEKPDKPNDVPNDNQQNNDVDEVVPSKPDAGGDIVTPEVEPKPKNIKNGVITDKLYFSDKLTCKHEHMFDAASFNVPIYDQPDGDYFGNWTYRDKFGDAKVFMALINTYDDAVNHFKVVDGTLQVVGPDTMGAWKLTGVIAYLIYDPNRDNSGYHGYKLVFPNARNFQYNADDPTYCVGEYGWYNSTSHSIYPNEHNYQKVFDVNTCEFLTEYDPHSNGKRDVQVIFNPEYESWFQDYISVNDSIVNNEYVRG